MTELPSGTVTFLFTDIEGSTRLWERNPDAMWIAIGRHNAILDAAIAAHAGSHFKSIGDAYAVAFRDAPAAVAVADMAQRALAAEPWGETGPLRVRMAIHVGEATPVGGDYLAPSLNRLARLLATGYGGQVLLSEDVRRLVAEHLPHGVTLKNIGRHRLRDLLEPVQVSQLVIAGLPDHFPSLKSLELHPTNLPVQPNSLVGRGQEVAAVRAMLGRDDIRLITLTGVGGTGKTRLGLQVAAELSEAFADGVFFVDLAPIADASLVLPTIATTLGVREGGGQSLRDALVAYLAEKRLLLVLDNFEQVLDAAVE
ncbi:MAG: adenylate/guanylate cyclase domain-containing protein, partial [Chloroflexia bacterium]|nr:adenylate/guanylate cyclase domain-containing protein [Chloroflexia bacterium]